MRYRFLVSRFQNGLVQDVPHLHLLHLMLVSLLLVEDEGLEPETTVTTLAPLLRGAFTWKGAGVLETLVTVGRRTSWRGTLLAESVYLKDAARPSGVSRS
jgi:hypothetical protein